MDFPSRLINSIEAYMYVGLDITHFYGRRPPVFVCLLRLANRSQLQRAKVNYNSGRDIVFLLFET